MPVDLSGMTKAPPKRTEGTRRGRPPGIGTKKDQRTEAVNGIFQLVQFGCVATGNHADAAAIGMHAENISTEVVKLADINESIARAIDFLLTAGPYAGLVTACLPLVMQIMANHGRLPESTPGITPPSLLKLKFKVQLEQQKAAMEKEMQELRAFADAMQDNANEAETSPNGKAR